MHSIELDWFLFQTLPIYDYPYRRDRMKKPRFKAVLARAIIESIGN